MAGAGLFGEKSTAGWFWLVAGGWFVLREKYCWLVADKPSEQGASGRRGLNAKGAAAPHGSARGRALERRSAAQHDVAGSHSTYPCLTDVFSKFSKKTSKMVNTKVVE
jgi:hypothetical protein